MAIEQQLRQAREARQMSQEEVAKALFITRQTVSRWEQGHTLPNIYALQDLAELYGCSLTELVGGTQSETMGEKPEDRQASKVNWAALFGLFWFNLIVALGAMITIFALVASLWIIVASFVISPGLVVGAKLLALPISWGQLAISGCLCVGGLLLWQPLVRLTQMAWLRFKRYLRYNQRAVYNG